MKSYKPKGCSLRTKFARRLWEVIVGHAHANVGGIWDNLRLQTLERLTEVLVPEFGISAWNKDRRKLAGRMVGAIQRQRGLLPAAVKPCADDRIFGSASYWKPAA